MKSSIRRISVISMFALSSFTLSNIAQPQSAQAAIGFTAWPLLPLAIVGAVLEGVGVATGIASLAERSAGNYHRASALGWNSLAECVLGIIFLDANDNGNAQNGTVQTVDQAQAQKYGMTDAEMQAYNKAVLDGDIEQIIQQASQDLKSDSTHLEAKEVMHNLLSALPADAHIAFNKIASHLIVANAK